MPDNQIATLTTSYCDKLKERARDWHKGQHVGLPQNSREIAAQTEGFVDGFVAGYNSIVEILESVTEEMLLAEAKHFSEGWGEDNDTQSFFFGAKWAINLITNKDNLKQHGK